MPAFDNTWMLPNTSIASTSTRTDDNHLDESASSLRICCLCGHDFHSEEDLIDTRTRHPCSDLSCAHCTWLQRNRDSTCQRCSARFTCPFQEQTSPTAEVDGLPISSRRLAVPDDGYDGDDERGATSNAKPLPTEHMHLSHVPRPKQGEPTHKDSKAITHRPTRVKQ